MKRKLDEPDLAILRVMQKDADLSNKQMAAETHKSEATISNRVGRLKRSKVIRSIKAQIDPAAVGITTFGCINLHVEREADKTRVQLLTELKKHKGIVSGKSITGPASIEIKVAVADMKAFNRIKEALASIPNLMVMSSHLEIEDIIPDRGLDF